MNRTVFFDLLLSQYRNSSSKYAFFMNDQTLLNITQLCQCKPLVLSEQVTSRVTGIGLPSVDLFSDIVDGFLKRLVPMGILNHLIDYHTWILYRNGIYKAVDEDPKVLTMDDLSFGFILWLIACVISTIGYLLEIARFKMRKKVRTLIGLVLFLMTLNSCLKKGH